MSDVRVNPDHWMYKLACQPCTELRKKEVQLAGTDKPSILSIILIAGGLILLGSINEKEK